MLGPTGTGDLKGNAKSTSQKSTCILMMKGNSLLA